MLLSSLLVQTHDGCGRTTKRLLIRTACVQGPMSEKAGRAALKSDMGPGKET